MQYAIPSEATGRSSAGRHFDAHFKSQESLGGPMAHAKQDEGSVAEGSALAGRRQDARAPFRAQKRIEHVGMTGTAVATIIAAASSRAGSKYIVEVCDVVWGSAVRCGAVRNNVAWVWYGDVKAVQTICNGHRRRGRLGWRAEQCCGVPNSVVGTIPIRSVFFFCLVSCAKMVHEDGVESGEEKRSGG